jgi:hypothetical protein
LDQGNPIYFSGRLAIFFMHWLFQPTNTVLDSDLIMTNIYGTNHKGHCPTCNAERNAEIVASHHEHFKDEDEPFWSSSEYRILKCRGCNSEYFQKEDVFSAKVGFFDYERKMFKVIPVDTSEIASFIGNIAIFNGKATAHIHVSVATKDGIVHGGHLLELIAGPTLEVFVTVEPTALYKKTDKKYDAGVIDPFLEK